MLYKYVQNCFNMEYILTNRLNQDILEHFFGAIRSRGYLNDHHFPKEFIYMMRKYIMDILKIMKQFPKYGTSFGC